MLKRGFINIKHFQLYMIINVNDVSKVHIYVQLKFIMFNGICITLIMKQYFHTKTGNLRELTVSGT